MAPWWRFQLWPDSQTYRKPEKNPGQAGKWHVANFDLPAGICPYCREEVKAGAMVCPHCRKQQGNLGRVGEVGKAIALLCAAALLILFLVGLLLTVL